MFIQIFHRGKFVNEVFVQLPVVNTGFKNEQLSFQERVEENKRLVDLVIKDFKANQLPTFIKRPDEEVQIAIVFQSSMNKADKPKLCSPPLEVGELPVIKKSEFKRPPAEYSNPQIPTELLGEKNSSKPVKVGIKPVRINRDRHRALISYEY
jgi:hypothetical protein